MKKILFSGSCVALITPFKNNKVDFVSLRRLINYQLKNKTDAILILGTTGEPATLSKSEKIKIIKFARRLTQNKAILLVGTGCNNTKKTIEESKIAVENGADGLLIVTPYYNKCTQKGLIEHYKSIANHIDIPIIVYNVPSRTGVNINVETMLELSKIPQICGIKEASGNIGQIMKLVNLLGDKIAIYSGDDSLNYLFMCLGADGVISVTANILPSEIKKLVDNFNKNDYIISKNLHHKLLEINTKLFIEVNPIPIKYACSILKLCRNEIRLPLTPLQEENALIINNCLNELGFKL